MPFLALAFLLASDPDPVAVKLTRKATVEYNAGEFGRAFLDYQGAYELEPIPELLFDMAQCQRELHHWERADFFYRRYLRERPQARNRAKVEALVAQMQEHAQGTPPKSPDTPSIAQAPPLPPAPPSPSAALRSDRPASSTALPSTDPMNFPPDASGEAAPPSPVNTQPAGASRGAPAGAWVLGTIGAVALLGGGGLAVAVLLQPDQLSGNPPMHSLTYGQLLAVNTEGTVAVGLAIGGAVLLGAGVLWGALAR